MLIVHGWQASSRSNWFPEAKAFFEAKGFLVCAPDLPGDYDPQLSNWLQIVKSFEPDENWILMGHSLGGVAIMRHLEQAKKPVAQTILISTPVNEMKFSPLKDFFAKEFAWEKIKQNAGKINLIYELDDQVVPIEHGHILAGELGVTLETVPGAVHLCQMDINILDKAING